MTLDVLRVLAESAEPSPSPSTLPDAVAETAEKTWGWLTGTPLQLTLIVLGSVLTLFLTRILIRSTTERIAAGQRRSSRRRSVLPVPDALQTQEIDRATLTAATATTESHLAPSFGVLAGPTTGEAKVGGAAAQAHSAEELWREAVLSNPERRSQRARTLGSVLRSIASLVIFSIALFLVLDVLNINVAPFLASAGIAGVALGFGAQTLVKDFLSGIFMLTEDQYGVGDTITVGQVTGTVEAVALRVTSVRDQDGTLWFIRNGEILTVGNRTQGWSRATVTVELPNSTDLAMALRALKRAARTVLRDTSAGPMLMEAPSVSGIDALTNTSYTLTITARTRPGKQWDVARVMRAAVRGELDRVHISRSSASQQVVLMREDTQPRSGSLTDGNTELSPTPPTAAASPSAKPVGGGSDETSAGER